MLITLRSFISPLCSRRVTSFRCKTFANQVKQRFPNKAKIPQQHSSLVLPLKRLVVLIAAFKMVKKKAEDHSVYCNLLQLSWRAISVLSRALVLKYVKSILEALVALWKKPTTNWCRVIVMNDTILLTLRNWLGYRLIKEKYLYTPPTIHSCSLTLAKPTHKNAQINVGKIRDVGFLFPNFPCWLVYGTTTRFYSWLITVSARSLVSGQTRIKLQARLSPRVPLFVLTTLSLQLWSVKAGFH